MSDDNYYQEFIDANKPQDTTDVVLPGWVTDKNSSLAAFRAIQTLYSQKNKYIQKHRLKSDYTKKSTFQIQKSEVARIACVNPQPLFNSNSYSAQLSAHLQVINDKLEEQKNRRISQRSTGLRTKNKDQLVKEVQEQRRISTETLNELVDAAYERTLENLPLDVRTKLKIGI